MALRYNRCVSEPLLNALHLGPFSGLVRLGTTRPFTDLQLRAYPATDVRIAMGESPVKKCWATLFVGLTKVLNLHEHEGNFWLSPPGGQGLQGEAGQMWNSAWTERRPSAGWADMWPKVQRFADKAIRMVEERFTVEGEVQSFLCTDAEDLFSVIDRESVIGFESNTEKKQCYSSLQVPLTSAVKLARGQTPKSFGGRLDILAVDDAGRLLVIEVKPGGQAGGIELAPLQATFYARLFQTWCDTVKVDSVNILERMLAQRRLLGLSKRSPKLRYPLEIVPVVAIGQPIKDECAVLDRLKNVVQALRKSGHGCDNLEVWKVRRSVAREKLRLF